MKTARLRWVIAIAWGLVLVCSASELSVVPASASGLQSSADATGAAANNAFAAWRTAAAGYASSASWEALFRSAWR